MVKIVGIAASIILLLAGCDRWVYPLWAQSIIYCPETLEPLYETTYDLSTRTGNDPVLAEDFKPVSEYIPQPVNGTRMVCPGTNIPLNGFEYFYWKRGYSLPKLAYQAVSLLTKDKKGNFVWLPYSYEELINILALD